jgi:hypothetical protein
MGPPSLDPLESLDDEHATSARLAATTKGSTNRRERMTVLSANHAPTILARNSMSALPECAIDASRRAADGAPE